MANLKIITWNLHGAANYKGNYKMPAFVVQTIVDMKADIIVLTEYIKNESSKKINDKLQKKYEIFDYYNGINNGVFIAVSREIIGLNIKIENDNNDLVSSFNKNLDFLQVNIEINNKPISIVGSRVRIMLNGSAEEKLKYKQKQYDILNDHSKELGTNFVIIGDLNAHGTWLKKNGEYNGGEVHITKGHSYYWMNHGELAMAPLDNCISKGLTFLNSKYVWDFREASENKNIYYNQGRLVLPVKKNYPDHAILVTNFEI